MIFPGGVDVEISGGFVSMMLVDFVLSDVET
jgi:hypothetical protein